MREDEKGFLYPEIDSAKCVSCGACMRVCAWQNAAVKNVPLKCWAAVARDKRLLRGSASGGAFAVLAEQILVEGGIVFGAVLDFTDGHAVPHHIGITDSSELWRLQGSKYVQSDIRDTYKQVQRSLQEKRKVLFSGTPCQVAGLYGFLKCNYEYLTTVDLICHGVPSARMFDDYLQIEMHRKNAKAVVSYVFRDKRKGWGRIARLRCEMPDGDMVTCFLPARLTSYNTFFLDGFSYRESCYNCKYACERRPGDLTLGDYWGIAEAHPEWAGENWMKDGVSCMIANTPKGQRQAERLQESLSMTESTFGKIARKNDQLSHISERPAGREELLEMYRPGVYEPLERYFREHYGKQRLIHYVFNALPVQLQEWIKKLFQK